METILEGVSYVRDRKKVLDGVSLSLTDRRIGVVGRNGSGKSTLARLICGLIKPTSGKIRVNGIDVWRDRKNAVETVGIVFQNPDHQIIFPTVSEEIAFGISQLGHSKRDARERALQTLSRFGHETWADRAIHTLSQGQRHLVCLMSVMAMRPAVIVLDEPFTGPDLPTIMQLHRHLHSLDVSQILITHDISALAGFDRVVWLDRGRIRRDGEARAVLEEFRTEMERLGRSDDFADFAD